MAVVSLDEAVRRLRIRLGYDGLVALAEDRIIEALNTGYTEISLAGVAGLTSTFSARTRGSITLTVSGHTAGESILSLTEDLAGAGIFPGDYFLDDNDNDYIVYDLVDDLGIGNCSLNVGSPITTSLVGHTLTLHRRSIEMPLAGSVLRVSYDNSRIPLKADALAPVDLYLGSSNASPSGSVAAYDAGYFAYANKAFVSLWPMPGLDKRVVVLASKVYERQELGSEINLPESVINSWLEASRKAFVNWQGAVDPVQAALAKDSARSSSAALTEAASADEPFIR